MRFRMQIGYQIHKNYIFAVHSWYLLFIAHFSVRVSTIVNCLYISHYFVHIIATFILYNGHLAGFYFPGFMLFGIKAKCINFSIRLHLKEKPPPDRKHGQLGQQTSWLILFCQMSARELHVHDVVCQQRKRHISFTRAANELSCN